MNPGTLPRTWLIPLVLVVAAGCAADTEETFGFTQSAAPLISGSAILFEADTLSATRILSLDAEGLLDFGADAEGRIVDRGVLADGRFALLVAEPSSLWLVDPADATVESIPLSQGFDRLSFDPWGRYLLLSYAPQSTGTGDSIFFNANEVGALHLETGTWSSHIIQGQRPRAFDFAPPLTLGDPDVAHDYVLVRGVGQIVLLHLGDVDAVNRQRLIRLDSPTAETGLQVSNVLFNEEDPDDPFDAVVFLTVGGSNQLYAVSLLPGDPGSERILQPSINLVPMPNRAAGLYRFVLEGEEHLLVPSQNGQHLSVVHVATQSLVSHVLSAPLRQAVLYEEVREGRPRPTALLYDVQGGRVAFVDLDRFADAGEGAVLWREVGEGVRDVQVLEGPERMAVFAFAENRGLAVAPLRTRVPTPIPARAALQSTLVTSRHFIGALRTGQVAWVDLVTQAGQQLDLERRIHALYALDALDRLVVVHDDPWGHVTILQLSDPGVGPLAEWRGLTFEGLFDKRGQR